MEHRKMGESYYVRLERGEEVLENLTAFVSEHGIEAASFLGIGAVEDVELGYYELKTKTYHRKQFSDDYELVNLTGNLSFVDDAPYVHAHVTIGDAEFRAHSGHLFRALIAVTGEFVVTPLPGGKVHRKHDEGCGLNLWNLA